MNNIDDMASKQVVQINISNFKKNSAMDIKKQFSDDELGLLEDMKILGGLSPEDPTINHGIQIGCGIHIYLTDCSCGTKA